MTGLNRYFYVSLAVHLTMGCALAFLTPLKGKQLQALTVDFNLQPPIPPAHSLDAPSVLARMSAQKPAAPPKLSSDARTEERDVPHAPPAPPPDAPVAATPIAGTGSTVTSATPAQPSPAATPVTSNSSSANGTENGMHGRGRPATGPIAAGLAPADREKTAYLREQFTYIRDAVMRRVTYPEHARRKGWSGKVLLSFIVSEDGSVHDLKVVRGSGFPLLDREAVEAVTRATPFPRPPVRVEVALPVSYRLM